MHRKHMDRPDDKECTEGVGSFLCPIFFSISFSFFPWREKKEIKMFTWWCLKTNCKGTVVSKLGKEQLVKAHRNCLGFSLSTVHSGQKIVTNVLKLWTFKIYVATTYTEIVVNSLHGIFIIKTCDIMFENSSKYQIYV